MAAAVSGDTPNNTRPVHPYYAHLDGLRAVAVTMVLFFHFNLLGVTGGYLGVDVFYVLSGFLVSGNILRDAQAQDGFAMGRFFARRFWRLYPSALLTAAWVIAVARYLFPAQLRLAVSKSVIASALSAANVLFWSESGYWDESSKLKPLLHMWSLSVEEQFYLFWPLVLVIAYKFTPSARRTPSPQTTTPPRSVWITILSLSNLSLVTAAALGQTYPAAVFYLFPLRIFEFGAGAMTLMLLKESDSLREIGPKSYRYEILSVFAVAVLIVACLVCSETRFSTPGIPSLPVVLSTVALIVTPETYLSRFFLANSIMRWVGRMSYALYLVHWPIWVFVRYTNDALMLNIPDSAMALGCLATTLVLAALQNSLVEEPFRRGKRSHLKNLCAALSISLVVSYATIGVTSEGWASSEKMAKSGYELRHERFMFCHDGNSRSGCDIGTGRRVAYVLGDSMVLSLEAAFSEIANKHNVSFVVGSTPGCLDVVIDEYNSRHHCPFITKEIYNEMPSGDQQLPVFLSLFAKPTAVAQFDKRIKPQLLWLTENGFDVIWLGNPPGAGYDAYKCIERTNLVRFIGRVLGSHGCPEFGGPVEENAESFRLWKRSVTSILRADKFISLYPPFTIDGADEDNDNGLKEYQVLDVNEELLYIDDHHLSNRGANMVVPVLEEYMVAHGIL